MVAKKGYSRMIETYVISIPNETKRYNFIKSQLALYPFFNSHFIDPIIGKDLSLKFLETYYDKEKAINDLGRELTLNEIGCALSHRKAWEQILQQPNCDYGLILEDDALISGNFARIQQELISFLDKRDDPFILLLTPTEYIANKYYFKHEYLNIYRFFNGWYTTGYIINKKAITILLNIFPKVFYPADVWNIYNKYIHIYSSAPYLISISVSEVITSTINNNAKSFNSKNKEQRLNSFIIFSSFKAILKKIFSKIYKTIKSIKATKLIF